MTLEWRPRETTAEEDARALAIAIAAGTVVGATAFWLARTLLGRDTIHLAPREMTAPPEGTDELRASERAARRRLERGDA